MGNIHHEIVAAVKLRLGQANADGHQSAGRDGTPLGKAEGGGLETLTLLVEDIVGITREGESRGGAQQGYTRGEHSQHGEGKNMSREL